MRVIIAGKRDYINREKVFSGIKNAFHEFGQPDLIIEGGATGVDALAAEYAKAHNIPSKCFPADWKTHGKAAGPIRNRQMAEYAAEDKDAHLIAFSNREARGTQSMIYEAICAGLSVHIYYI